MRASPRVLLPLLLAVGCQDDPATAIVSAMAADQPTLRRVTHFRLVAERGDDTKYDEVFPATAFEHPGSLTFQDASDGDDRKLLRVRFEGYSGDPGEKGAKLVISNAARLPFVKQKTKLLRLGMSQECLDTTCEAADYTCRHGECVPELIEDPDRDLPDTTSGQDGNTLDPAKFDDLPPVAGQGGAGAGGQAGVSGISGQGGLAGDGGTAGQAGLSGSSGQAGAGQGGSGGGGQGGLAGDGGQGGAGQGGSSGSSGHGEGGQGGLAGDGGQGGLAGGGGQGGAAGAAGQGGLSGSSGQAGAGQAGSGGGPPLVVVSLASRGDHTCALLAGDQVKCWGYNQDGQLGLGDTKNRGASKDTMGKDLPPVDLGTTSSHVKQLALGGKHSCVLFEDGTVKCWGFNQQGQLGVGDGDTRGNQPGEMGDALPKARLLKKAKELASGENHVCVVTVDKQVSCWGSNEHGQLGRGDKLSRGHQLPAPMLDDPESDNSAPGTTGEPLPQASNSTCTVDSNGTWCWGYNQYGQLGLGDMNDRGDGPGEMNSSLKINFGDSKSPPTQLTSGGNHTCVIIDGSVKCWGWNNSGQLGLGNNLSRGDDPGEMGNQLTSVDLGTSDQLMQVVAGQAHTCVLFKSGQVKCWGSNSDGQLGLGVSGNVGDNGGQMGNGLSFVKLGDGQKVAQLAAGSHHTCALLKTGRVKCWGANQLGQLGLSDTKSRGNSTADMGDALLFVELGSTP